MSSLQNDIAEVMRTACPPISGGHAPVVRAITAKVEREKIIIDRDELPEVVPAKGYESGWMRIPSGHIFPRTVTPAEMRKAAAEYLALAEHQESKASALAERREVTARFLGFEGYECLHHDAPGRFAVDEVMRLQDKAEVLS